MSKLTNPAEERFETLYKWYSEYPDNMDELGRSQEDLPLMRSNLESDKSTRLKIDQFIQSLDTSRIEELGDKVVELETKLSELIKALELEITRARSEFEAKFEVEKSMIISNRKQELQDRVSSVGLSDSDKSIVSFIIRKLDIEFDYTSYISIIGKEKSLSVERHKARLDHLNRLLAEIKSRYQEPISELKKEVQFVKSKWEHQISTSNEEVEVLREGLTQSLSDIEEKKRVLKENLEAIKSDIDKQIKQLDKTYSKQIKEARKNGKPVQYLISSKQLELNKLDSQFQSVIDNYNFNIQELNKQIDKVKFDTQIRLKKAVDNANALLEQFNA